MNNQQAAVVLREVSPAQIFARPTADDLWLGPTRESVLSQLAIPAPVRVLLGPDSSGRTTLLRHLTHRSSVPGATLRVSGPKADAKGVLGSVLESAELTSEGLATDEMRRVVLAFIEECLRLKLKVVLEVDDADTLSETAWQEIEDLASVRLEGHQPELLMSLARLDEASSPAADHVRAQKAPALAMVSWLEPAETSDYLSWRFDRFGLEGINTRAATRLIAKSTQGRFASIDHICQMALLLLRNGAGNAININVACEAMRLLRGSRSEKKPAPESPEPAQLKIVS